MDGAPLTRMRPEVCELLRARFAHEPTDCVYVSMPITSGRAYFTHLCKGEVLDAARREALRAANVRRAQRVVDRARRHFSTRRLVEPSALDEPPGWHQDDFHALWMGFIANHATTIIMVDGWEYSTGCVWELVAALDISIEVLDENFHHLRSSEIFNLTRQSSIVIQDSRWSAAYTALLKQIKSVPL